MDRWCVRVWKKIEMIVTPKSLSSTPRVHLDYIRGGRLCVNRNFVREHMMKAESREGWGRGSYPSQDSTGLWGAGGGSNHTTSFPYKKSAVIHKPLPIFFGGCGLRSICQNHMLVHQISRILVTCSHRGHTALIFLCTSSFFFFHFRFLTIIPRTLSMVDCPLHTTAIYILSTILHSSVGTRG